MICVSTPSRIHFGLVTISGPGTTAECPQQSVELPRRYASAGLMVERPGIKLLATPAKTWSAEGPLAERARGFALQVAQALLPGRIEPMHLNIEHAAPEHCGFGTGTQLGMAVARVIAKANRLVGLSNVALARLVGRGARTALGISGFEIGGFLLETGRVSETADVPRTLMQHFPPAWRLVLFVPPFGRGLHGEAEKEAFEQLRSQSMDSANEEELLNCMREISRAVGAGNFPVFCEAAYEFNARVGSIFGPIQGGTYAHPLTTEIISFLRREGIHGVGQSSWGPAGFAIVESEESGRDLVARIRHRFSLDDSAMILTPAANHGAKIEIS